ncbi:hypothetical protein QBC39DRAFT_332965 [Podospora conica]|nr:hypothetical protein QBC39DRAFT_332965 [Schizothecium conicum]
MREMKDRVDRMAAQQSAKKIQGSVALIILERLRGMLQILTPIPIQKSCSNAKSAQHDITACWHRPQTHEYPDHAPRTHDPMAATQTFVTKSEFNSFRDDVGAEFRSLNGHVNQLRSDVNGLRSDVNGLRSDVKELKVTVLQMAARSRNSKLRNPTLLIRAVPTACAGSPRGIAEPDLALFPRYAD